MPETSLGHAKSRWDDETHLNFLELWKRNRSNIYLSKDGKKNMSAEFSRMAGRKYNKHKQKTIGITRRRNELFLRAN